VRFTALTYWRAVRVGLRDELFFYEAGNMPKWAAQMGRTSGVMERALRERGWLTWALVALAA
jgi:hypothetical protein